MNTLRQFVIPFTGLSLGDHDYQFKIKDEFFEHFEYSEIKNADIDVNVCVEKQTTMLHVTFEISGKVDFICDRCQEAYSQEIRTSERLIVKFGENQSQSDDEIVILPLSENKIDLSQHIFEYINLIFPYKRVHPDDKNGNSMCNKEMIEKLKSLEMAKKVDPRWDELKKINL